MTKTEKTTLLLVDDNRDNLFALGQVFAEHLPGCEILTAEGAEEGLALAATIRVDGILADMQMPGTDGIEMCRQLKSGEKTSRIPVVLITAHRSTSALRAGGLDAGAEDFIARPIDNLELVARIRTVLRMKKAEDRLRAANDDLEKKVALQTAFMRDYKKAVESTQDLVVAISTSYRYLLANEAYLEYYGLDRDRILGRTLTEALGVDYFEGNARPLLDRSLAGEQIKIETSLTFPDLGLRHMQKYYSPMKNSDGAIEGVVCIMRDITERKETEEALLESRREFEKLFRQFRALLDGITDPLMLLSPEMEIVWANEPAGSYFGRESAELPGETCYDLWGNCSEFCEECPVQSAFSEGMKEELLKVTPDGRHWGVKAFPLKEADGKVGNVIMLATDITEKAKLREEALRSSRLASLGELAAGVAHEINNPNALVLLNVQMLSDAWPDIAAVLDERFREKGDYPLGRMKYSRIAGEIPRILGGIQEGGTRIRRIVEDLKGFVRQDAGEDFEVFDLNRAVQAAVRLVANPIKKSTRNFVTSYAEDLPKVEGCFQKIEQVVVNLVINACQALPSPERGVFVSTFFDRQRASAVVEVRDEGVGIAEENLPHITDPFYTTRRESGGTGLGLSVSARIVREHDGRLEFSSTLGKGTTISLCLPARQEAEIR